MKPCCEALKHAVFSACDNHDSPFRCGDALLHYSPRFDEYGIIIHDGGCSVSVIRFCPWCGTKFPESRRDRWFEELESMGYENPLGDDSIPEAYTDDRWYRNKSSHPETGREP